MFVGSERDSSARAGRTLPAPWLPGLRLTRELVAVAAVAAGFVLLAVTPWSWAAVFLLIIAVFGLTLERMPPTRRPAGAASLSRLGRLVRAGVLAGGALAGAGGALRAVVDPVLPDVAPTDLMVGREAALSGAVGVAFGGVLACVGWLVDLLVALWERRRGPRCCATGSRPRRRPRAAAS